jgi:hypothetical protein
MPWTDDERRAYQREYKRRRYHADPEYRRRHLARVAATDAVKFRRMERKPCEGCGSADGVQKHHDDYDSPLAVRWLCEVCHGAAHGKASVGTNPRAG